MSWLDTQNETFKFTVATWRARGADPKLVDELLAALEAVDVLEKELGPYDDGEFDPADYPPEIAERLRPMHPAMDDAFNHMADCVDAMKASMKAPVLPEARAD